MALPGIPIPGNQCIGDSLDTLNTAFQTLDTSLQTLSTPTATGSTTARSLEDRFADVVNVKDFGAVGDGVADDTAAIQAAIDYANTLESKVKFPYGIYKVTSTLNVKTSTFFDRSYIKSSGLPLNGIVFDITGNWTTHYDVKISGDSTEKSNEVEAIRVTAYNVTLYTPFVSTIGFGIVNRAFHTNVHSPRIYQCSTGISASAPSQSYQINLFQIFGGVISNSDDYSVFIGDNRSQFITTIPSTGQHGSTIAFHGTQMMGTSRWRNVSSVHINNCDFEKSLYGISNTAIEIENYIRGINITSPFYNGYDYGIKTEGSEIRGLSVENPTYNTGHKKCGLYVASDQFPYTYTNSSTLGTCFTEAPEIHTGQRQVAATNCKLDEVNIQTLGISGGVQTANSEPLYQYPSARYFDGSTTYSNDSNYGRRYKTPKTSLSGTFNTNKFTLTTLSDVYTLNAGDRFTIPTYANGVITNVNYESGQLTLSDGFTSTPIVSTISQLTSVWV